MEMTSVLIRSGKTRLLSIEQNHHFGTGTRSQLGSFYCMRPARKDLGSQWLSIILQVSVFCRWEWRWKDGLHSHSRCHWDHRAHGWVWPQTPGERRETLSRIWEKLLKGQSTQHTDLSLTFLPWQPFCSPPSPGVVWFLSLATKGLQDLAPSNYPDISPITPHWHSTYQPCEAKW